MTTETLDRPSEAPPVTPGEVLRAELRKRDHLKQDQLAAAMAVSRFTISQIINGQRAVTADTALRLARVLGPSPEFWLNLQMATDLYWARRKAGEVIAALQPLPGTPSDKPMPISLSALKKGALR